MPRMSDRVLQVVEEGRKLRVFVLVHPELATSVIPYIQYCRLSSVTGAVQQPYVHIFRGRGQRKGKLTTQPASNPATDSNVGCMSVPTSAPSVSATSDSDSSFSSCNEQMKELGELPGGRCGVGQYRRKQNLKSLRRSLVMRKVRIGAASLLFLKNI